MIYETQAAEIIIQRSDINFRQETNVSGGYNHLGVMIGSLGIATPSPSLTSIPTFPTPSSPTLLQERICQCVYSTKANKRWLT